MCTNLEFFTSLNQVTRRSARIANGEVVSSDGIGEGFIFIKSKCGNLVKIKLKNVLYFKNRSYGKILSVLNLVQENIEIQYNKNGCTLSYQNKEFSTELSSSGISTIQDFSGQINTLASIFTVQNCVHEWHRILSHRNLSDIKQLKHKGFNFKKCSCSDQCEACIQGKLSRKSFPKQANKVDQVLSVVVSDVCGPMPVLSIHKFRYVITFTDISSGYTEIKFLKEKSEVPDKVIEYIERIKVQFDRKPKIFRTDRGTEYTNERLQQYLRREGIVFQSTCGYSPEQNGISERKNRTLIEAARTMLIESRLPQNLWPEAINEANYNLNRVVSKNDKLKTPYEKFYNKTQDNQDFHEFGSEVYIFVPEIFRRKLDVKGIKCKYLGHDNQAKGYRVYDPVSRCVKISRDVVFVKDKNKNPVNSNQDINAQDNIQDNLESTSGNQNTESSIIPVYLDEIKPAIQNQVAVPNEELNEEEDEFHDAEEIIQQPVQEQNPAFEIQNQVNEFPNQVERLNPRPVRSNAGRLPARFADYEVNNIQHLEPRSYKEAIQSSDKDKWMEAMNDEIKCLNDNNTWDLVDLPESRHPVGSNWVWYNHQRQGTTALCSWFQKRMEG